MGAWTKAGGAIALKGLPGHNNCGSELTRQGISLSLLFGIETKSFEVN